MSDVRVFEVVAKTKTGQVCPFQVTEIISIDGKPYQPAGDLEVLREHLIHLDGRVTAIEHVIGREPDGE